MADARRDVRRQALGSAEEIAEFLAGELREGDVLLILSNGSFDGLVRQADRAAGGEVLRPRETSVTMAPEFAAQRAYLSAARRSVVLSLFFVAAVRRARRFDTRCRLPIRRNIFST